MAIASGTKLGPYEILAPLGAGGMGEVYRACDPRLDREVAIKVLPSRLSSDSSLKQRLEREAKAVSKLSHPHICTLYDIGHQDGVDFLVMEYLEGETLEQRLVKGPLPPDRTLRYAAQIADALAKAHKLGITHRDLKPANVMLTKSGAKLMDFGLAKQSGVAPLAAALTEMTVDQAKLTSEGMIVGTFQYMAPEQLEGKEADARTDIFAFGELIYEMVTGKPAFSGKSRASLIAAILTTDPPPLTQLQPITPVTLERVVRKCLGKDPDDRWQNAADLASELKWIGEGGSQAGATAALIPGRTQREKLLWALATLALCAAAVVATVYVRPSAPQAGVIRSSLPPEDGASPIWTGDLAGPAVVSPDGSTLAFVTTREQGVSALWVRKLNAVHGHALAGTDGATFPFWSSDSRSVGFFAGSKLKTISVEGGTPTEVCDAQGGRGGTWNAQGIIIFAPAAFQSVLMQVPASGGIPKPVTVLDTSKHDSHRWPYFLPDGKHFLYLALTHNRPRDPNDGIYYASLDGKENRMLMTAYTNATYAAGHLLFMRDSDLMAQSMDPETGNLRGSTERVVEDVLVDGSIWRAAFDASSSGLLAYAAGGLFPAQAVWYDRAGKNLGAAGDKALNLGTVRLSPDGTRLATDSGDVNPDIWINELKRQVNTRLTFGSGASSTPVWSPDGRWIAFGSFRGKDNFYRKASNGVGQEELLLDGDGRNMEPSDWSPDGKSLLFRIGEFPASEIWLLPLEGDRKPVPLVQGNFVAANARFSPDGRWVAYNSSESRRPEVYVTPFGNGGGKSQVSGAGGILPIWRRDGRELFYWSLDNTLISVPVQIKKNAVEVGAPHLMFRLRQPLGNVGLPYDVTADGQRFLVIETTGQASKPITLVTNWAAELKHQ